VIPDDKFKGFEVFLDIENENEIAVPNNVIHCVRDLKQILRNPLVIRHDNVQVTRRQRTFVPKRMLVRWLSSMSESTCGCWYKYP
ncbi:unnamed protein product, partial [Rotaria socialis]